MAHTVRSLPAAVWHGPHHIRRKLQVHSRAQIAAWVTGHGLRPGAPR